MRITLQRLTLRNFKGIRDLTVDFGQITGIWGDNATGKTTVLDGFNWILFDKDSQNKKDFEIKTLNADGNPIHQLNHEVEGTLLVDGRPVTFARSTARNGPNSVERQNESSLDIRQINSWMAFP